MLQHVNKRCTEATLQTGSARVLTVHQPQMMLIFASSVGHQLKLHEQWTFGQHSSPLYIPATASTKLYYLLTERWWVWETCLRFYAAALQLKVELASVQVRWPTVTSPCHPNVSLVHEKRQCKRNILAPVALWTNNAACSPLRHKYADQTQNMTHDP